MQPETFGSLVNLCKYKTFKPLTGLRNQGYGEKERKLFFVSSFVMTIALLIKLTCPYCDDEECFKQIQNIQRHCQRKHSILLPSRSRGDQPPKDSRKYTEALHEKYPSIPVKLTCPCCCDLFVNKSALKTHVDEQHNVL